MDHEFPAPRNRTNESSRPSMHPNHTFIHVAQGNASRELKRTQEEQKGTFQRNMVLHSLPSVLHEEFLERHFALQQSNYEFAVKCLNPHCMSANLSPLLSRRLRFPREEFRIFWRFPLRKPFATEEVLVWKKAVAE